MKKIFKLVAFILAAVMSLGMFAGCHEKDEIAITIGNHKYTSAMYSCALYSAASQARSKIYSYVSQSGGDVKNIKYENYKFDAEGNVTATGVVPYETLVKNEAINSLKRFSIVQDKMTAEGLTLPQDYKDSAIYNARAYWNIGCDYQTYAMYGDSAASQNTPYAYLLEPNGVLYNTFEQYSIYNANINYYFEHTYGKGGSKEVPENTLKEYLTTHFDIADTMEFSMLDSANTALSEDKLAALKTKVEGYADRINKGEDFKVIYEEYEAELKKEQESTSSSTSSSASSSTTSSATDSTTSSTDSSTSSDTTSSGDKEFVPEVYTQLYGDEESGYNDTHFKEIHESAVGKAFVIEDTESKCYILLVRRDILEEDYYFDNFEISILYALKQEEFDAEIKAIADTLTPIEDKHATRPFKVKDIKFS